MEGWRGVGKGGYTRAVPYASYPTARYFAPFSRVTVRAPYRLSMDHVYGIAAHRVPLSLSFNLAFWRVHVRPPPPRTPPLPLGLRTLSTPVSCLGVPLQMLFPELFAAPVSLLLKRPSEIHISSFLSPPDFVTPSRHPPTLTSVAAFSPGYSQCCRTQPVSGYGNNGAPDVRGQ